MALGSDFKPVSPKAFKLALTYLLKLVPSPTGKIDKAAIINVSPSNPDVIDNIKRKRERR